MIGGTADAFNVSRVLKGAGITADATTGVFTVINGGDFVCEFQLHGKSMSADADLQLIVDGAIVDSLFYEHDATNEGITCTLRAYNVPAGATVYFGGVSENGLSGDDITSDGDVTGVALNKRASCKLIQVAESTKVDPDLLTPEVIASIRIGQNSGGSLQAENGGVSLSHSNTSTFFGLGSNVAGSAVKIPIAAVDVVETVGTGFQLNDTEDAVEVLADNRVQVLAKVTGTVVGTNSPGNTWAGYLARERATTPGVWEVVDSAQASQTQNATTFNGGSLSFEWSGPALAGDKFAVYVNGTGSSSRIDGVTLSARTIPQQNVESVDPNLVPVDPIGFATFDLAANITPTLGQLINFGANFSLSNGAMPAGVTYNGDGTWTFQPGSRYRVQFEGVMTGATDSASLWFAEAGALTTPLGSLGGASGMSSTGARTLNQEAVYEFTPVAATTFGVTSSTADTLSGVAFNPATSTNGRSRMTIEALPTSTVVYVDPTLTEAKTLDRFMRYASSTFSGSLWDTVDTPVDAAVLDTVGRAPSTTNIVDNGDGTVTCLAGAEYKLTASIAWNAESTTNNNNTAYRWFDGTSYVGAGGLAWHEQDATGASSPAVHYTGVLAVDTTFSVRNDVADDTGNEFLRGSHIIVEMLPTEEVVTPGDVPVEDVEVLLASGDALTGSSTLDIGQTWGSLASEYSQVRFDIWPDAAPSSSIRATQTVSTEDWRDTTTVFPYSEGTSLRIQLGDMDIAGTTLTISETGTVWDTVNVRVYGIRPQKTVINTADVVVDDQTSSGYFDVGDMRMQWGTEAISGASSPAVVSFTFPVPFGASPVVTASPEALESTVYTLSSVSSTGFQIRPDENTTNSRQNIASTLHWQAIGPKP